MTRVNCSVEKFSNHEECLVTRIMRGRDMLDPSRAVSLRAELPRCFIDAFLDHRVGEDHFGKGGGS